MKKRFKIMIAILFLIVSATLFTPFGIVNAKTSKLSKPKVSISEVTQCSVTMTWKKIKNANKYQVYRFSYNTGEYIKIGTTKKLMYMDLNLTEDTKYSYKVQALSGKRDIKNSSKSKAVSATTGLNNQTTDNPTKIPEEKEDNPIDKKPTNSGEQCKKCHGTGNLGYFKCTVCKGTGFRDCIMCQGKGKTKCNFCGATGKRWNTITISYDLCTFCNGTGYNLCPYCTNGKVSCELCNGTGQIAIECKECDGTGYVK